MTNDDLVGVWSAAGDENNGGRRARIMYTLDGYMAVVSTPADRKPVDETTARMDLDAANPTQRAEAAAGCVAYSGRFEVIDDVVHHHIEVALNPNLVGQTRTRRIELDGDNLTLCTLPDASGRVDRIHWRRVPRN
jgi:hypothetical protein